MPCSDARAARAQPFTRAAVTGGGPSGGRRAAPASP
jgi:hypothetical protein